MKRALRILPFVFPISLLALLIACSTVPETGRRRLDLLGGKNAAQINAAGLAQFQKYKQSRRISRDPRYTVPLARVASRLKQVIDLKGAQWEFVVFEEDSPNAFAVPGGKVGVHTGLFKVAQNEEQLAAVIGHEIGHVVAGHASERMSNKVLAQMGGALLGAVTKNSASAKTIGQVYGMGAQYGAILPFSRKHELEADKMGALYMARAGYDPREAITFWQRMGQYAKQTGARKPAEFMSTHPMDGRRVQDLKDFMPRAMSEWKGAGGAVPARARSVALR